MTTPQVESTLALIKPHAYSSRHAILAAIKRAGFAVAAQQTVTLTPPMATALFSEYAEHPSFAALTAAAVAGPSEALILRKVDAVAAWRTLLGPSTLSEARTAAPLSMRARFGVDDVCNAAHGSPTCEAAAADIALLFPTFVNPDVPKGPDAKDYLSRTVCPVLTKALMDLCRLTPPDPIEWLGEYMLQAAGVPPPVPVPEGTTDAHVLQPSVSDAPIAVPEKAPKRRIFFVLGGPGSGKGTQCARLVERFSFAHFSAGDLLRAEVKAGSEQGLMIDEMIKEGKIVPGEITISLLKSAVENSDAPGVLIDGFPRQLNQAGAFEKDVSDFEFVLFFDCPEEEMERRLLERGKTSGRVDDNVESIKKRFRTFVQTSMPVIEYYEAKGKVHRIDATQSVEAISDQIQALF